MSSDQKSKLVTDAVSEFLDREIAKRSPDSMLPPIYTYPANGLRRLTDKPLERPATEKDKASV